MGICTLLFVICIDARNVCFWFCGLFEFILSHSDGGSEADDSAAVDVDDGAMFTCTDEKENTLLGNSKVCPLCYV